MREDNHLFPGNYHSLQMRCICWLERKYQNISRIVVVTSPSECLLLKFFAQTFQIDMIRSSVIHLGASSVLIGRGSG